jgi:hypothetical protein
MIGSPFAGITLTGSVGVSQPVSVATSTPDKSPCYDKQAFYVVAKVSLANGSQKSNLVGASIIINLEKRGRVFECYQAYY